MDGRSLFRWSIHAVETNARVEGMKPRGGIDVHVFMGQRLNELRCAKGISTRDLSDALPYANATQRIERIERGEVKRINISFIARVSGALHIHPASLFTRCDFPYQREFSPDELVAHILGRLEVFCMMRHIFHIHLCKLASLSPDYIAKMQNGSGGGSLQRLVRLADELDIPVWQLFA
jgi:transcriptional regulator with XRE-family HTH domain